MILGLGIDFLETSRVERELAQGEWLLEDGIFTPEEILYCSSTDQPARRFAACFAAKEAALKALGIRVTDLAMFREVEVGPGAGGGPEIWLRQRPKTESEQLGVRRIRLAIAQNANHTGATVILED